MPALFLPTYLISAILSVSLLHRIGLHQPHAGLAAALIALPLSFIVTWIYDQLFGEIPAKLAHTRIPRPQPTAWDNVEEAFILDENPHVALTSAPGR